MRSPGRVTIAKCEGFVARPVDAASVVVAHRLSTIRLCDTVAHLERVQATKTLDQMVTLVPEFAWAVELAGLASGDSAFTSRGEP
jgi:hypothetical protein